MDILLSELEFQGWTSLFLLRDTYCKFSGLEIYQFYGWGMVRDSMFITTIRGQSIYLKAVDIS